MAPESIPRSGLLASAPKATPTANPSGMLCKVIAKYKQNASLPVCFDTLLLYPQTNLSASEVKFYQLINKKCSPCTEKPTTAGTQGVEPLLF
jgi:hypothetical protein